MSDETLKDFLFWGTTLGSGVIAWWILARVVWSPKVTDELKRYIAAALSGMIALLFWAAEIAMQYVTMPSDWRAWVEAAAGIVGVAFLTSQGAQARQKQARLRQARLRQEQLRG